MRRRFDPRRQRQLSERREILERRVSPPPRLSLLNTEERVHFGKARRVDRLADALPLATYRAHGIDARLVVQPDLVPQRATGSQRLAPADVMKPEEQRVGYRSAVGE